MSWGHFSHHLDSSSLPSACHISVTEVLHTLEEWATQVTWEFFVVVFLVICSLFRCNIVIIVYEDLFLDHEVLQRPDKILVDVKAIMCHQDWCQECAWTEASVFELICVLDRDQAVSLTVKDESWTRHTMHFTQVVELLSHNAGNKANFVCGYAFNGCVGRHEYESSWIVLCSEMRWRTTSEGTTHN